MTAIEARIRTKLAEVYEPEGVELWLTSPHSWLDGRCAVDLIAAGQGHRVEDVVDRLVGGGF